MAHEIRVTAEPALTLTAQLWQGVTQVGSSITLTEAAAGYYTGSVPGGTAAGAYDVHVLNGTERVAVAPLRWSGTAEILPAAAGDAMAMTSGERALHFAEHNQTQADIEALAIGAGISDPFDRPTTEYADGTVGAALNKLNITEADEPVIVLPGPPADTGLCRVYGYVEGADNLKLPNVSVTVELLPADLAVASERLIAGRKVTLKTDAQGRLIGPTGDPWVDLQRTDLLAADGGADVYYEVTSAQLGVHRRRVELTATTANLRTLLVAQAAP